MMNDKDDSQIVHTIRVGKDEVLQKRKLYKSKPPFAMYGSKQTIKGSNMTDAINHVDVLEVMENVTPNGVYVLRTLRDMVEVKDYTDFSTEVHVQFKRSALSTSDQRRWDKGLINVQQLGLVATVSRGRYMINLYFLIPNNFEEHKDVWFGLVNKVNESSEEMG